MSSSLLELGDPRVQQVRVETEALVVDLQDGRSLAVPLSWYPRLWHATVEERQQWRLIGNGTGIYWSSVDEDISVRGLLAGKPSNERPESLKRWLSERKGG
ncbi:MAG: DUF2442 domain-containing protein [Bacteroidota bacterium]